MIKSYKLKLYPNKVKAKEINKLLAFWRDHVNYKINIFWNFPQVSGSYCPTEYALGGRLKRDSSIKAWEIVKGAKKTEQKKQPCFESMEIDLNPASVYIIPEFKTKEFDIWFNCISLNKNHRLKLPAKRIQIFNEALSKGKLKRSFKLIRKNDDYFMECYVEFPEVKKENENMIGIDVGLNNAITTSDGIVLGKELKNLRIRTKWRKYKKKLSPVKQGLNRCAKELTKQYPDTDFVVEQLLFKGKKKRSREFRRRNNNWAYNHLTKQLELLGKVKGFNLIKVNPAYSSQRCQMCGFTSNVNRIGDCFKCCQCGHRGNADLIGAINILQFGRVARNFRSDNQSIGG